MYTVEGQRQIQLIITKKTEFVGAFKTILIKLNSFDINWSLSLTSAQTFHKGFGRYIRFSFVKITDLFLLTLQLPAL